MKQILVSEELLRQALAQLEINRTNFYKGPSKSMCKCLAGGNDEVIDALRAALEQPAVEPVAWTPVANGLPASGVVVLACYRNRLGNLRRIRAEWVAAKTQEADGSDESECAEYDEATDTFYIAQDWYERIDNWGDYSSVAVTEGEVTHWMPLPPAPDAAPQAQQADELKQLQEQNRWLDAKVASNETAMEQALEALKYGKPMFDVYWGGDQFADAIKALEDALK